MQLYCWGENSSKPNGPRTFLSPVAHKLTGKFFNICCGERYNLFLKAEGIVFSSGNNSRGQLGRRCKRAVGCVEGLEEVVAIDCGQDHSLALTVSGRVYSWGAGNDGQLGLCTKPHSASIPSQVPIALPLPIVQVACGDFHSLALTKGGDVFAWGSNSFGQLGLGKDVSVQSKPVLVCALTGVAVTQISAGGNHTLFLTLSNLVYCCGANKRGQLGLNRVDENGRFNICAVPALRLLDVSFISCGESHTAVLTNEGKVYTFGEGSSGQLGHNSATNEIKPRLVDGLDEPVTQIECGRHHTLVLSSSGQVWAFGRGDEGQMGTGKPEGSLSPILIQRSCTSDWEAAADNEILKISAGWNTNFVYSSPVKKSDHGQITGRLEATKLQKWLNVGKNNAEVKREIDLMFMTSSSLVACFTKATSSPLEPGALTVDVEGASKTFDQLMAVPWIKQSVNLDLLVELLVLATSLKCPEIFTILLSCPLLQEDSNVMRKVIALAVSIVRLSEKIQDILKKWWSSLPAEILLKHILVFKNGLAFMLKNGLLATHNPAVKHLLETLKLLYKANKVGQTYKVPLSSFYVEELKTSVSPERDVGLWICLSKVEDNETTPVIFCRYPFVFPLDYKAAVFNIHARMIKNAHHVAHNMSFTCPRAFEEFGGETSGPVFQLTLRRTHLVEDSFRQLAAADHEAFQRELVVQFADDRKTMRVNIRDFFLHAFDELMAPESEIFIYNDTQTLAWFPPKPKKDEKFYFLFGVLCGLALYNHNMIHLPFPQVFYKKLLALKPSLSDMKEFDPVLAESWRCILEDYTSDEVDALQIPFSVTWGGEEVVLDPNEAANGVTGSNRKKFVAACIDHIFNKSVAVIFEAFKRGFYKVCERDVVDFFQPEELQSVTVGQENYDWEVFKENTIYEGQYHANHPNILTFWEVFDTLTEEQKKKFLLFLTGSDRVPFQGMKCLQMKVGVLPDGTDKHCPQSLTCHTLLLLPVYRRCPVDRTMRAKLIKAIDHNRGFWKE